MAFVLVIFEVLSVLFPDYSRLGAKNQGRGGIPRKKTAWDGRPIRVNQIFRLQ